MFNKLLITLSCFLLLFLALGFHFQSHFTKEAYAQNIIQYFPDTQFDKDQIKRDLIQRRYSTKWGRVYFDDKPLPYVNPLGFIALPEFGIASDGRVFHGDRLLVGVDGTTLSFYPDNWDYIKDKNGSYFLLSLQKVKHEGKLRPFTGLLQGHLAKDDKYLYSAGKRVEGANPNDISFIDGWSKYYFFIDGKVFYGDQEITEADITTFTGYSESTNMIFAEDKNYIYKNGKVRKKR